VLRALAILLLKALFKPMVVMVVVERLTSPKPTIFKLITLLFSQMVIMAAVFRYSPTLVI
jgi:hypothetical protein